MLTHFSKKNPFFKIFNSTFISLPAPVNISLFWNLGSLLSACLIMQLISGILLSTTYYPSMESSFMLVTKTMELSDKGWLIRFIHMNGASLFFIFLYMHIGRGLYYSSFLYKHTWSVGVTIFIMTMATAFLGYVLPVNQMSYWGASVITNLFSEVPYIGPSLINLIWGAPSVGSPTLLRFFTFHFILPFIITALVMVHITLLHMTGSSNPLGLFSNMEKFQFHPYFSIKDALTLMMASIPFLAITFYTPLMLGDNENFTPANLAVTPQHIQPEWYFLFAYAILRSIPNKLGGVIALLMSVTVLYFTPFTHMANFKSLMAYPLSKLMFWTWSTVIMMLTWIGMCPVEDPYIFTGQILTALYFLYFILLPLSTKLQDSLLTH
uniref:Cytochrome b n=1 Tax=Haploginglymus sp. JP-2016 TaxID=1867951 RepID=A0A330IW30_9CRUS|nr:CYTB [Haploginglymus sp. JP-2016]